MTATLTVQDSVTPDDLVTPVQAFLGYIDGEWQTFDTMRSWHPTALGISLTVTGAFRAAVADVERGDLTFDGALKWLRMMWTLGMRRPCLYVSLSSANLLVEWLRVRGAARADYRLWTAHWTEWPHRCDVSCGLHGTAAGATQWTSHYRGGHRDASEAGVAWTRRLIADARRAGAAA